MADESDTTNGETSGAETDMTPNDPNINEYGISHADWDDLGQNEQRDIAHEHGDDWHGQPPPGTDGGDDSSQQTTASADTGRPPTFHADTPPTFHSDAQQEAWLADQRAKLWDFSELERKENVQKGRDDWSRSNKEREDRLRSERRDEAADQAREEREKQESRWSTEDEGEGLLRSRDRERYVDRDMEASKDPNVNEYGISHNDWDDLSQNEQRDFAHSFGDDWLGQPPLSDEFGGTSRQTFHTFEAALVDKGLTPNEIALVRERQGGTITKFEQDDVDAVNARRGVLGAQAVAEQVEAALLAQGLTPDEIAYVRERQGGTLTQFKQDDADAMNARRDALRAQAVDEQFEAALLAQGATADEIAYVRDRQGGTLTQFEQDDADAVNARRDALRAQAVAEQVEQVDERMEAALLAQGATPEEIDYVRERQGGTITKFEQDDADAVNAMRGDRAARDDEANRLELVAANELYAESMGEFGSRDGTFDLGAQAVAEQVEAALLAQGATPDEIAYVRERQGGTLTKFDQDDADAVNAMRQAAATSSASAQEVESLDYQDQLADQYRAIADYQVKADLWESEESMGAPEVSPDLAQARAVQMSLDSGEQVDLQHSFEAGFVPHGPPELDPVAQQLAGLEAARFTLPDPMAEGQETVDAQAIYALAFPGRSPEEIAAERDLYPSRTSFDREVIDRAKLNTRNDPAQSAMVDEFAISQGYQPLELDMSADAVNARRRRAIIGTAALWTAPFTIGWGALASGAAGAAIGAGAHAVAPADGEAWFELTDADPMRAAHGVQEGFVTGYGGYKLGRGGLMLAGKYGPKIIGSLPGRWGTEAAGGAVFDTGWALRDGRITRNEALYEIGGGAVLSPAFDLGTRGAKGAVQVSRLASRIVLPTQLSIPKTGLTVPLGGGFVPLTTPAPRVPHLTVVRQGKEGEAISGDVFDRMALTGEYEGVIGQTAVSFKPGRMSEALHQANPDLPLYFSATPVGKIISTGPIAMDKPKLGPSEQYFFASPGDVNPNFMGGSAFGGSGSSPGIFAYSPLDAAAVGSQFERVMSAPDSVKFYRHGYEAERGIHSGEQIPPAKRVATAGVLGGQLYLGAHVTPPSFSQRLQANVNAITDAVRGEQRGRFVFQKATPEQLADRIEADQMAASQTWDESLASGKVDSEDRAGFMDSSYQRTLDDIAEEQATFDRAMADRIEAGQMAASQTWDDSLASGKVDSEDRAGFMDAAHQRTLDDIAEEQATFDRAMADRIEADQMAASQTWDESLTSGKVDSEDRAEFMDAAYQRTLDDIAEEQALYDRALAAQADLEDMLRQNGGTPAERALLERVQGYLGKRSLHPGLSLDLEAGIERELLAFDDSRRTIGDPRTPLTPEPLRDLPGDLNPEPLRDLPGDLNPEPLRDLPGDLNPEPLRDLPGGLPPEPLRDLPGGLPPEPLRDLPGGLPPEPLRDLPGGLNPEPLRDLPGGLPPESLRDLPGGLPPEPLRDLPGGLPPEPLRDLPGELPPEPLRDLPGELPPESLRDLPGGLPPESLRDLPGGLPPEPPNKRRPRVRVKSIEAEIEEGVHEGEYPSVVQLITPPAVVTTVLGTGEERAEALGTIRAVEVVATEPEPVIGASHEGRTAEITTGRSGRVRVRPIQETHYKPESHLTYRPRVPKRAGLTPKPPKPPSTKAPKPRGRKRGAAFTAAMRMRK